MEEEKQIPQRSEIEQVGVVLATAMEAGHILLENGAEIFRVEDTMRRIAQAFGVYSEDFFVLSNGIFTTGENPKHREHGVFARVQHIPVRGAQLDQVVAVNQLSREIGEGKYTIDEVREKLQEIRERKRKPFWVQVFASGIGSACFCAMFHGGVQDCLVSFLAGFLLYIFVLKCSAPHLSKITGNLFGGTLATLICLMCSHFGLVQDMNPTIIGAIIPLVPGIAFTNGVRDIANGHYLSGTVRLLDAMLVFLCIAIGVGWVFLLYGRLLGGALL